MTNRDQSQGQPQGPGLREPALTLTMSSGGQPRPGGLGEAGFLLLLESSTSSLVPVPWDGELVIGRVPEAAVRVRSASVSRTHARIHSRAGEVSVSDLGSHNGTYVNGERIMAPRRLASGDAINLCDVTVVFYGPAPRRRPLHQTPTYLRERLDEELDRSTRARTALALLLIETPQPLDPAYVAATLAGKLRLSDVVALDGAQRVWVLRPDCDEGEASAIAQLLLAALSSSAAIPKAGFAVYPADGIDGSALWEGARAAAEQAAAGTVLGAGAAVSTLHLGEHTLLIADPAMVHVYTLIRRLAPSDLTVLICGETGTGKELAAQALHTLSTRSKERLLSINCAALPENLAESELFGYERGAFTGAVTSKAGLLEAAQGGTLFLDEVGELSPAIQAKLLRALESRKLMRVGDLRERPFSARIIAATNRDLGEEVAKERFRADLYFRLSTAILHLPPLRVRRRELPLLATAFLREARARTGQPPVLLSPAALELLLAYRWPGNVRELKNAMDYAAAIAVDDFIDPAHLPAPIRELAAQSPAEVTGGDGKTVTQMARALLRMPLPNKLDCIEETLIAEALAMASGNKTAAARLLGVHRKVIERRLARQSTQDSES